MAKETESLLPLGAPLAPIFDLHESLGHLDAAQRQLVLRAISRPRGTRTLSLSSHLDALEDLIESAFGSMEPSDFDVHDYVGDPAPQYVPDEWLAELEATLPEDGAPFIVSWDDAD